MALLFNFNMPKPKRFNYRPLYYDERKERLEKMKAEAEAMGKEARYMGLQKGFLSDQRERTKMRRASLERGSVMRFMMILIILLVILYVIMPDLFQAIWTGGK